MKYPKSLLFAPALAVMALASADAATLLTNTNVTNRNNFSGTVGINFTVTGTAGIDDLIVTSLGFQDSNDNGLATAHDVGIWNSAGTLIASITVPTGTGGTLFDHYRYGGITPNLAVFPSGTVILTAGQTYTLGAQVFNGGDAWTDAHGIPANHFTMSNATPSGFGDVHNGGGGFSQPTSNGTGDDLRWGPGNMQFTVVPEPGAALLGSLALLALVRRRR